MVERNTMLSYCGLSSHESRWVMGRNSIFSSYLLSFLIFLAMYYKTPTTIDTPIWNNRFAFEQRETVLWKAEIVVPQMIAWGLEDVQLGETIAFAEQSEDGSIETVCGLKALVCLERVGNTENEISPSSTKSPSRSSSTENHAPTPIYIIDNHNHALYCWWKEWEAWVIEKGLPVVHIDQHSDMNDPKEWIGTTNQQTLESIARYTNEVCTIADFIKPAQKVGLIGECKQVRSEYALLHDWWAHNNQSSHTPYILDIDLDFWAPAMSIQQVEKTFTITRRLIASAEIVTIATSPYFIDQDEALRILRRLLG